MCKANPRVTVFMAVYNSEKFLAESIESVLSQTFNDFELLIVNDGSTDNSIDIISSYNDPRIRLLHNEQNMGLVYTRNRGIREARGEYVATLDSDDIAYPERLEEQVAFLDKNSEFGLVGSWVQLIDENSNPTGKIWDFNIPPEQMRPASLFYSVVANSASMVRKTVVNGIFYRDEYPLAEDYDFWIRVLKRCKGWNLPKILVKYRIFNKSISREKAAFMEECTRKIVIEQLRLLEIEPSEEEIKIHWRLRTYDFESNKHFIEETGKWLDKLYQANRKKQIYTEDPFKKLLAEYWFFLCNSSTLHGLWTFNKYYSLPLSSAENLGRLKRFKFFIKCVLKW